MKNKMLITSLIFTNTLSTFAYLTPGPSTGASAGSHSSRSKNDSTAPSTYQPLTSSGRPSRYNPENKRNINILKMSADKMKDLRKKEMSARSQNPQLAAANWQKGLNMNSFIESQLYYKNLSLKQARVEIQNNKKSVAEVIASIQLEKTEALLKNAELKNLTELNSIDHSLIKSVADAVAKIKNGEILNLHDQVAGSLSQLPKDQLAKIMKENKGDISTKEPHIGGTIVTGESQDTPVFDDVLHSQPKGGEILSRAFKLEFRNGWDSFMDLATELRDFYIAKGSEDKKDRLSNGYQDKTDRLLKKIKSEIDKEVPPSNPMDDPVNYLPVLTGAYGEAIKNSVAGLTEQAQKDAQLGLAAAAEIAKTQAKEDDSALTESEQVAVIQMIQGLAELATQNTITVPQVAGNSQENMGVQIGPQAQAALIAVDVESEQVKEATPISTSDVVSAIVSNTSYFSESRSAHDSETTDTASPTKSEGTEGSPNSDSTTSGFGSSNPSSGYSSSNYSGD